MAPRAELSLGLMLDHVFVDGSKTSAYCPMIDALENVISENFSIHQLDPAFFVALIRIHLGCRIRPRIRRDVIKVGLVGAD